MWLYSNKINTIIVSLLSVLYKLLLKNLTEIRFRMVARFLAYVLQHLR